MNNNDQLLRSTLRKYSITYILINMSLCASNIIDELVVARLIGSDAMAAIGMASPYTAFLYIFFGAFTMGAQQICASALSVGNKKKANTIVNSTMLILIAAMLLLTALAFSLDDAMCLLFGAKQSSEEIYVLLKEYLHGNFIGILPTAMYMLLSPIVAIDGNRRCVSIASIATSVINIVADWAAIAVFHSGIFGIGLATSLSWAAGCLVLLTNFIRGQSMFRLSLLHPSFEFVKEILEIGSPQIAKQGSKLLSRICRNRIILFFGGSIAMSALSVNASMTGFLYALGIGISEGVKYCTQMLYSTRDELYLKRMAKCSFRLIMEFTLALSLLVVIFSKQIASLFVQGDAELLRLTTISIMCLGLSIPLNAVNCALISYVQATKKLKFTSVMTFTHRLIGILIATVVMGAIFGQIGVFIAIPVAEILTIGVYLVYALATGRNKKKLVDKLMVLPDSFTADITARLAMTVTTIEEVAGVSEYIWNFLQSNGCNDKRKIYVASLALEEMCGNVVSHGFCMDDKKHNCDISILIDKDNNIYICIRDDCPQFDVRKQFEAIDSAGPESNIGIKMIYGLAKDVRYVNLLNLNTLIIEM